MSRTDHAISSEQRGAIKNARKRSDFSRKTARTNVVPGRFHVMTRIIGRSQTADMLEKCDDLLNAVAALEVGEHHRTAGPHAAGVVGHHV